jgi:hypothetical protein
VVPGSGGATDISHYFLNNPGTKAVSQTPSQSGKGMLTFFYPAAIYPAPGISANGIVNQALLFHEALHGVYASWDAILLGDFGYNGITDPSCKITEYLELKIWGGTVSGCN